MRRCLEKPNPKLSSGPERKHSLHSVSRETREPWTRHPNPLDTCEKSQNAAGERALTLG